MKILQLNIWGGKLGKQIIELLEREKPDIVCFQEAIVFPNDISGDLFFSTLEKFKSVCNFQYSFFSPVFGFSYMNQKADFGNAILSKLPIVRSETIFTRKQYIENQDLLDGDFNIRNLQHVEVEYGDRVFHILNHHGHHLIEHKNGDEETLRQCMQIAEYVKKLEGSVILTGDFNLSPLSESLQSINTVLDNQCLIHDITTTRTPLTHKTEVCDFIFTSKDVIAKNFKVYGDIASDHAALGIEVE